jgi:hypothetical protein
LRLRRCPLSRDDSLPAYTQAERRCPAAAYLPEESEIRHRMFGVNTGGIFEAELVMTARRGTMPPLFDPKYR